MTRPAHATVTDRESRLRRSLKRLGFDLIDAERGNFYIQAPRLQDQQDGGPVRPRFSPAWSSGPSASKGEPKLRRPVSAKL